MTARRLVAYLLMAPAALLFAALFVGPFVSGGLWTGLAVIGAMVLILAAVIAAAKGSLMLEDEREERKR